MADFGIIDGMRRNNFIRHKRKAIAKYPLDTGAIKKELLRKFDFEMAYLMCQRMKPRFDGVLPSKKSLRANAISVVNSILLDPEIDYVHSGQFKVEKVWLDEETYSYELFFVPLFTSGPFIEDKTNKILDMEIPENSAVNGRPSETDEIPF